MSTVLIKARWPQVKVVVLSTYPDYAANVLEAKADAFISQGTPPDELLVTLAAVTVSAKKEESP